MKAIDATRRAPITIDAAASLGDAARLLEQHAVGALLVVDEGRLAGIVTDRDLVVRGLARGNTDGRVDSVMTTDVRTADADADLRDVVRLLGETPVRRVPLLRDGVPVGMVTADDLIVDLLADLADVTRPIGAEVLFGHREPPVPAVPAAL
jgi:CBS domain-containing protein